MKIKTKLIEIKKIKDTRKVKTNLNFLGFTLYFTDHAELEHYKLNISFLNHNHLPNFSSDKPERISRNEMRTVPNKTVLSVRRPSELHDYQNMDLFFKEYFYFTKTSDGQKYRVSGYSTELIGCPQVLCLNSYLGRRENSSL